MKKLLFIIIFICAPLYFWGLNDFAKNVPTVPIREARATDGIVVLTGGAMRLEKGIAILNSKPNTKMLISGVGEQTNLQAIEANLNPSVAMLYPDKIELGYGARNTHENAIEVSKWVAINKIRSFYLITSNLHMQRSLLEFERRMKNTEIIAIPVFPPNAPNTQDIFFSVNNFTTIAREYNKYITTKIYYKLADLFL